MDLRPLLSIRAVVQGVKAEPVGIGAPDVGAPAGLTREKPSLFRLPVAAGDRPQRHAQGVGQFSLGGQSITGLQPSLVYQSRDAVADGKVLGPGLLPDRGDQYCYHDNISIDEYIYSFYSLLYRFCHDLK